MAVLKYIWSDGKASKTHHLYCECDICRGDEEKQKEKMLRNGHWVPGMESPSERVGDNRDLEDKLKDLF